MACMVVPCQGGGGSGVESQQSIERNELRHLHAANNQVVHSHLNTNNPFKKTKRTHIVFFKNPYMTPGLLLF